MIAPIFAAFAAASASTVYLSVESSQPDFNGKSLSAFHEDASSSTFFLADDKKNSYFQYDDGQLYLQPNADLHMLVGETANTFTLGFNNQAQASIDRGYVAINGSTNVFYVCDGYVKYDTYRYEEQGYKGVSVFSSSDSLPANCEPIKIKASIV